MAGHGKNVVAEYVGSSADASELNEQLALVWAQAVANDDRRRKIAELLEVAPDQLKADSPPIGIEPGGAAIDVVGAAIHVVHWAAWDVAFGAMTALARDEAKKRMASVWALLRDEVSKRFPRRDALGEPRHLDDDSG